MAKLPNCLVVVALAGAVLLASGCVHYEPKPLAPTQAMHDLESRTLTDEGLRAFIETNASDAAKDWPRRSWDLAGLTLAAFYYHPSLDVARAQVGVAEAGVITAGGRPNPTVSFAPQYNVSALSGINPWTLGFNFDIPIETAGKRGKRIAQAKHLSAAARLNIATIAWGVRNNLRARLLDFTAARQREALLQQQLSIQEQIVTLLGQQAQAGAIASSELATFRIALQKARLDLADAQRQQTESRGHLAKAIGLSVHALDTVELVFNLNDSFGATNLTSAEIRHHALLGRADILGALAEYAAAESALQLEIARQYPDLHLSPGYQFDQGDSKWSLGMTLDLPVLNQNQGPIAEAEARREEAVARFDAIQARALAEIESSVEVFRVTESNSATLRSLADEQAKRRDSIEVQFRAGAADQLDFLNAQFEFAAAGLAQLDGRVKLQQAIGALEDAVQRPIDAATAPPPAVFSPGPKMSSPENK